MSSSHLLSFDQHSELSCPSLVVLVVKNTLANAGDVRDAGSIPGSGRSPGGGHGNPLQCSCLENLMDREAWQVTVHRVLKSWSRWSNLAQHSTAQCSATGCLSIKTDEEANMVRRYLDDKHSELGRSESLALSKATLCWCSSLKTLGHSFCSDNGNSSTGSGTNPAAAREDDCLSIPMSP